MYSSRLGGLQMRDRNKVDSELRLAAALLRSARIHGQPTPVNQRLNDLLDERLRMDTGQRDHS